MCYSQTPSAAHECCHHQTNGTVIYATVDVTKKKKHAEPAVSPTCNYMNLEPAAPSSSAAVVANVNGRKPAAADNYMNLEFSESLCHYENAKNVLAKAAGAANACDRCGHRKRGADCAENAGGPGGDGKGDYMTMEPVNGGGRMAEAVKRNLFPGYLPMCPASGGASHGRQPDMLKNIMNRGLAEKSASIPSLNELQCKPPPDVAKNRNLCRMDEPRKRSSSAGSARCVPAVAVAVDGDDDEPLSAADQSSRGGASDHTSSAESMTSQIAKCAGPPPPPPTLATQPSVAPAADPDDVAADRNSQQTAALVHIRRSSSVPCKNNRDSSSSNDSGVSTGSLRYRGADFAEFELPLTTAMSTMRHRRTMAAADHAPAGCVHGSLPRRSKSTDRLKELSFRFHKFVGPIKSSSAGAEVPVCLKKDKGKSSSCYYNRYMIQCFQVTM